jgi:eukaryotic-like serine/threonine-protein kinase
MLKTGVEIADRFNLTRRLGGTDDAPVWEAVDQRRNSRVVLKLQPASAPGVGLEGQYRASQGLQHPGIARPVEVLRSGELEGLVMDLAAAGDLGTLRGQSYPAFLPHVQQVAQALAYLHSQGLVHGDVKPSNVLLDAKRGAQLADFGNLKPAGAERGANEPFSPYSAAPQQRAACPAQPSDDIYGFGALLYEMLTGQPPGYAPPAPGPQAPVAELRPIQPAPQRLIDLTERCLQDSTEQRPRSMQEIDTELNAIAASQTLTRPSAPPLTPPKTAAEVLRPTWQRTVAAAAADPKQLQRQGFRSGIAVAVVAILAIVALALFIVPARRSSIPAPAAPTPVIGPAPPSSTVAPSEDNVDLQALAQQKSAADEQRASVNSRLAALKSAGSESWAAAGTAAAMVALAAADALMQKRDYAAAQTKLTALAHDLTALEAQREPAFKALLQQGEGALQKGDSKGAASAFAQALAIRPGDAAAQRGARRAASLDALYTLLSSARVLEQQGRISEAAATYRKAESLDPLDPQAQAGAARTGGQLQADQFGRAMARAYAAIGQHQEAEARAALEEAKQIRPNDPEIARATAQLQAADSASQLSTALTQAHTAEASEHWQEAVSQYQHAVALDPTLVDARHAMEVATERARLDRELALIIAHPERTYSDAVYAAAHTTLQQGQAIAAPGPVLSHQLEQVADLLTQAATPVDVTLRSDNLTSVTVYRVGELGNFSQRALQLKPGRYVVVGTRSGYRDVRRELNISPGNSPQALLIQCVDPI